MADSGELHGAVPLLQDGLEHSARRVPQKIALVCGDHRVTYRTLDRRANALAHALRDAGVAPGDRVVIFGDNTIETVVAFWAVLLVLIALSLLFFLITIAKMTKA